MSSGRADHELPSVVYAVILPGGKSRLFNTERTAKSFASSQCSMNKIRCSIVKSDLLWEETDYDYENVLEAARQKAERWGARRR